MTNVIFFVLKASLKELSQTDDEDKRTFINLPERNFPAVWLGYSLVWFNWASNQLQMLIQTMFVFLSNLLCRRFSWRAFRRSCACTLRHWGWGTVRRVVSRQTFSTFQKASYFCCKNGLFVIFFVVQIPNQCWTSPVRNLLVIVFICETRYCFYHSRLLFEFFKHPSVSSIAGISHFTPSRSNIQKQFKRHSPQASEDDILCSKKTIRLSYFKICQLVILGLCQGISQNRVNSAWEANLSLTFRPSMSLFKFYTQDSFWPKDQQ